MSVAIDIPVADITEEDEKPSRTYKLDLENGRISGIVDGVEAVEQSITKAIHTLRFNNLIYDDDYGCEAGNVIHDKNVTPEYLETAIPEMIKDALSQDTRITDVYDFEIEFKGDEAYISFSVDTIYGETKMNEVL